MKTSRKRLVHFIYVGNHQKLKHELLIKFGCLIQTQTQTQTVWEFGYLTKPKPKPKPKLIDQTQTQYANPNFQTVWV